MTEPPISTTLPIGNTIEQLHALADIVIERQRQDLLFPEQAPGRPGAERALPLDALVERIGRMAKVEEQDGLLRQELVEVAAECVKWLEVLDRRARVARAYEADE